MGSLPFVGTQCRTIEFALTLYRKREIFEHGTLSRLRIANVTPEAYLHYPKYNEPEWQKEWRGTYTYCAAPKEVPVNSTEVNQVFAYNGVPHGFPQPDVGSYGAIGLDGNVCFDRYARLGPYGVGMREPKTNDSAINIQRNPFRGVKWGLLQNECFGQEFWSL